MNAPRTARVRLEDVARKAGVSKSIASRILNHTDLPVRPETRRRVVEAARSLNYRPHAGAQGLRRAKTGALGLLIPNLANPVYARIVAGAYREAAERDFALLLAEDAEPAESDDVFAELVLAGRIDGLIVASARPGHQLLSSLQAGSIPHVFVNRAVRGSGRNVVMDDARASFAAVDHLVALGHSRIGHVAGPRELDPARRRRSGFRRRAIDAGLEAAPVAEGEFSEQGGSSAASALLESSPEITAVYSSSLAQTIGVLEAAWRAGRRVPDDLSVVSYDDLPLAQYLRPPVTTIKMPLEALGAAGVDALVDQLLGAEPGNVTVPTEPEVVVRTSTGPPGRAR